MTSKTPSSVSPEFRERMVLEHEAQHPSRLGDGPADLPVDLSPAGGPAA